MAKVKYYGITWNLAGYSANRGASALIWREGYRGHSGNGFALDRPLDPRAEDHCYWIPTKYLEKVYDIEENE